MDSNNWFIHPYTDIVSVCNVCGQKSSKKCAGCKSIIYCSRDCQVKDWKQHKDLCKDLREDDDKSASLLLSTSRRYGISLPQLANITSIPCIGIIANNGNSSYMTITNVDKNLTEHVVKMEGKDAFVIVSNTGKFNLQPITMESDAYLQAERLLISQCQPQFKAQTELTVRFLGSQRVNMMIRGHYYYTCTIWHKDQQHTFATLFPDLLVSHINLCFDTEFQVQVQHKDETIVMKNTDLAAYCMQHLSLVPTGIEEVDSSH